MNPSNSVRTVLWVVLISASSLLRHVLGADNLNQAALPVYYLPQDCQQIFIDGFRQAVIVSQSSQRYSPNMNCRVVISSRSNNHLFRFTFHHLDLVDPKDGVCHDYVQLFNIHDHHFDLEMTSPMCGGNVPVTSYTSNSSSVALVFRTNEYKERSGFKVVYERLQNESEGEKELVGAMLASSAIKPAFFTWRSTGVLLLVLSIVRQFLQA